jgi:hypothetical protein
MLYKSKIHPLLEYGGAIIDGRPDNQIKRLENIHCQAALTCTGAYRHTNHDIFLEELGWPPLQMRRKHQMIGLMFKICSKYPLCI